MSTRNEPDDDGTKSPRYTAASMSSQRQSPRATPVDDRAGRSSGESAVDIDSDDGTIDPLLRALAEAPAVPIDGASARLLPGARIDSLRIDARIGQGGMGVVYRAYDVDLDRPVAIKVHRGDADGRQFARLLREAKVMARLSHPNVVTVYEVGRHQGQLFIAMEYVEGGSLSDWLAAEPRDVRDILRVFVEAGRGLAAAHALGLVHRDFKPDNVLIDATGRAKVADFGLARLATETEERGEGDSESGDDKLTRTGAAIGTPAYMAPEQFAGEEVGAAADQFSFCVSLYEALYGKRPFAGRSAVALEDAVTAGQVEAPADARVPAWVWRVIRRGLRPRTQDRFPSMDALVDALTPRSWRRWYPALFGGFAVAVAAGAWLGGSESTPDTCPTADEQIESAWGTERREAVRAAFSASEVPSAHFAQLHLETKLDAYASDWLRAQRDACEATHVRHEQSSEVLDRRMACLTRGLNALDGLVVVLTTADDEIITSATKLTAGLPDLQRCADAEALQEGIAPPPPEQVEAVAAARTRIAEVDALTRAGKTRGLVDDLDDLVAQAHATGYPPLMVEAEYTSGRVQEAAKLSSEAEASIDTALWRAVRIGYDELVPQIAIRLAFVVGWSQGRSDEGHRLLRLARASAGDDAEPALLANIESVAGTLYLRDQAPEAARDAYSREAEYARQVPGNTRIRVAEATVNLARVLDDLGRYDEAERSLTEAVAVYEQELPADDPRLGLALRSLANHYSRRGDHVAAVANAKRSADIREHTYGPDSLAIVPSLSMLATELGQLGETDRALEIVDRAIGIYQRRGVPPDRTYAELLHARIYLARHQDPETMLKWLEEAVRVFEQIEGPDSAESIPVRMNLASTSSALGRHEEAVTAADQVVAQLHPDENHRPDFWARLLSTAARIDLHAGRHASALERADASLARFALVDNPSDPKFGETLRLRARALHELGRDGEAERAYARALEVAIARGATPEELTDLRADASRPR